MDKGAAVSLNWEVIVVLILLLIGLLVAFFIIMNYGRGGVNVFEFLRGYL